MIGRNDIGMTTTLDDAAGIRDHAETRGLGFLGFWSAARDNGAAPARRRRAATAAASRRRPTRTPRRSADSGMTSDGQRWGNHHD